MNLKNLKNKVVVITGASSGIGLSLCRILSTQNCKIYGLARTSFKIPNVTFIPTDITDKLAVENAFEKIFSENKHVDVLVNNAGMGISGAIENAKAEDIDKIFSVNIDGAVNCIQAVLPKMRERKFGKIINISSVAGILPIPYQAFYSATKSSIILLTQCLRLELKPFNVQAGIVLPGDTKTPFTASRVKNIENSDYFERESKSVAVMEKDEQNGMSSEFVAKKIAKYANRKKLPVFLTVGFKYKIFLLLNKFLPNRFVLFIISKLY